MQSQLGWNDKMNLLWFRMSEVRRKKFDNSVWIPLRASQILSSVGARNVLGFEEEFFGVGSMAVPLDKRAEAEKLGWDQAGISRDSVGYMDRDRYVPADVFEDNRASFKAVPLVLEQRGNRDENRQWHLHQDFVITLGLLREGDLWLAMHEGYAEVARLHRDSSGSPILVETRAEFLKDYLCARNMALYIASYRSRIRIADPSADVPWLGTPEVESADLDRWEGHAVEIHEGGMPYGAETAVFHASRTDVSPDDDVPVIGPPWAGGIESRNWTLKSQGVRLLRVSGELWRREWVEPARNSPRIRTDKEAPTVHFLVDSRGTSESTETLRDGGRWLWFKAGVMMTLSHRRGGGLGWYTHDTGYVRASPDYDVDFGVNTLGLVTVYAKDVALLPEWQQRIWAAYNVTPEGGVAEELLASQARAEPADTQAPESLLSRALFSLNEVSASKLGFRILRDHENRSTILKDTHRFRSVDAAGLYALAKDIARLTADSIDATALHSVVAPPKGEKWGSLKSLERVLAGGSSDEKARKIMGPLVAAYELRHGDAHLKSDLRDALALASIDVSSPYVYQGAQLLASCVSSLDSIARELEQYPSSVP